MTVDAESGGLVPHRQLDLDAAENEEPVTALVRRLERGGLIDEVSLRTADLQDLSLDQAESLLRFFATLHRGSAWWVGDLYRFAEDRWNEEASQLANATSLGMSTITRYTTLAREFPPHERVRGLGISHHRLVLNLDAGARRAWLDRALGGDSRDEGPWTVDRLRQELRLAGLVRIPDANPEPAGISQVIEGTPAEMRTLPRDYETEPGPPSDCNRIIEAARAVIDSAGKPRYGPNGSRWEGRYHRAVDSGFLEELERALPDKGQT